MALHVSRSTKGVSTSSCRRACGRSLVDQNHSRASAAAMVRARASRTSAAARRKRALAAPSARVCAPVLETAR